MQALLRDLARAPAMSPGLPELDVPRIQQSDQYGLDTFSISAARCVVSAASAGMTDCVDVLTIMTASQYQTWHPQ